MKMLLNICLLLGYLIASSFIASNSAADTNSQAQPAEIEARLKHISQELRCLVCQNTTLADSDAPLAEDLRKEIRTQMQQGRSDAEVVDYLVERYGDFVRYRPPLKSSTYVLWFGPFILLIGGVALLWRVLKKRANAPDSSKQAIEIGEDE